MNTTSVTSAIVAVPWTSKHANPNRDCFAIGRTANIQCSTETLQAIAAGESFSDASRTAGDVIEWLASKFFVSVRVNEKVETGKVFCGGSNIVVL